MDEAGYTLEELAEAFDLTLRTARSHIQNLLPAHHKKGRGKLACYGQDTWNCFAAIKIAKRQGLTSQQISSILAELDQAQIDLVAEGQKELTIVPALTASRRALQAPAEQADSLASPAPSDPDKQHGATARNVAPRWRVLYSDDDLQITYHGHADSAQCEQVRMAAELIKRILA